MVKKHKENENNDRKSQARDTFWVFYVQFKCPKTAEKNKAKKEKRFLRDQKKNYSMLLPRVSLVFVCLYRELLLPRPSRSACSLQVDYKAINCPRNSLILLALSIFCMLIGSNKCSFTIKTYKKFALFVVVFAVYHVRKFQFSPS